MTKIKIIIKSLAGGGAERILLNFLKEFNSKFGEKNIELLVLLKEGELINDDLPKNISFCFEPVNKFSKLVCLARLFLFRQSIAKKFLQDSQEIIAISFLEGWGDMILHSYSSSNVLKKISWLHCNYDSLKRFNLTRLLFDRYAAKSNTINCVSRSVLNSIDGKFVNARHNVVYNFIDFDGIDAKLAQKTTVLSKDSINILFVGRLVEVKNLFFLLEAFKLTTQRTSNVVLNILGDGYLMEGLKTKVEELNLKGKVKFHGFSDNPYPMIRDCDILALSSWNEGLPTVLIEAAYVNTKAISTKCGSDELLNLFDYPNAIDFSAAEFANALISEINQKRNQIGKAIFLENFSFEAMLNGMTGTEIGI